MKNKLRDYSITSAGVATRYGLDGPGIKFRYGASSPHPFRLASGPTRPSLQWIPGLFFGGKAGGAWH